ncbi:PAS domain S-box protein [Desulfofustis glycolicus]|uniref:Transcriptional regulator, LuxR family n=1 Tax=Desulfofustis glycolicus DSM 9705 TaxID=1121409 RepID=A0A1M5XA06_9BACT|nr:PAS domain S-box protein [Desulfofustis glycolicus]MCB2218180.1 PAS domain S-box protein [Desulfobulbaceae bacterium]SHH96660.1 transcriptional regulator, LuxR family [Desulfofustis glycolicus DSM 9705]
MKQEEQCCQQRVGKSYYEVIFLNTNNLILIVGDDGVIVEANPKAYKVFQEQKLVGRFFGELLDLDSNILQIIKERYPFDQQHEIDVRIGNESLIFKMNVSPLLGDSNLTAGVIAILNDLTPEVDNRVLIESEMMCHVQEKAHLDKMLEMIFLSVGEGILLVDEDREIVRANSQASEIFGILEQKLCGEELEYLTDGEGMQILNGLFNSLVEGEKQQAEITGHYSNGHQFPIAVTVTRVDFRKRKFWPIIVRDITEQKEYEIKLQYEMKRSEEMNVTLSNVLKSIEKDRREREQQVKNKVKQSLLPSLQKMTKTNDLEIRSTYRELIAQQLIELTSGFESRLDAGLLKLTGTEIAICRVIQAGRSGKEICELMNLAFETLQTHRKNIRKKLGLRGRKVNLQAYLAGKNCDV